ncbi:SDR family NAD(P)-dependent oxidoreductase [Parasphingorhabdus sp.]|uniref:SDR family NAD(P)-dependent oxidoreductase n=1 Tax=Parasphingorhabdus sp. TaxID=2709688 RepID=UPI003A905CC9
MNALDRFDLTGKVALVTGGSRGLGRQMVMGLAQAGADVIIASRKIAGCEEVATIVEKTTGRNALAHACHVGNWDDVGNLVEASYDHFGKVDILINNAGMSPRYDSVDTISEELYDKILGVNLKGPFRLSALVGTRMANGDGGSIVNISSVGSIRPQPHIVPYAAAKAGLNAAGIGFSHAFGPKVRVNTILAGAFETDISTAWSEGFRKALRRQALERGGKPDEIVGAAIYFASDASSYTTGSILQVDGGLPN